MGWSVFPERYAGDPRKNRTTGIGLPYESGPGKIKWGTVFQ